MPSVGCYVLLAHNDFDQASQIRSVDLKIYKLQNSVDQTLTIEWFGKQPYFVSPKTQQITKTANLKLREEP